MILGLFENETFCMWFWIIGFSFFAILAIISEKIYNKKFEKRNKVHDPFFEDLLIRTKLKMDMENKKKETV